MSKPRRIAHTPTVVENRIPPSLAQIAKPVEKNDPVPLIVAAFGVALAGQILGNMVESLAEGATRPATSGIEYGTKLATYRMYRGITLDTMVAALKASIFTPERGDGAYVNIDDDKIKDAMDKIIQGTIVATSMVSEDAGEIVMESFQEAFSNATYYGIGGMFASMTAYRAGFMPPQNMFTDPGFDLLDAATKANLDALTGYNAYATTAQQALRIANKIVDSYTKSDKLDSLLRIFAHYTDIDLTMLANLDRQFETMVDHIIEQTRMALTVLLRRTIDIRDTIRAAYADWKANIIMENDFRILLLDALLELREILSLKDEILDDLDYVIDSVPTPDSDAMASVADVIDRIEKALDDYWLDEFTEMQQYLETLKLARRLTKSTGLTWTYISLKTGQQHSFSW